MDDIALARPRVGPRRALKELSYSFSPILRHVEETLAEGYAQRSIIVVVTYPLKFKYVNGVDMILEGALWYYFTSKVYGSIYTTSNDIFNAQ